jgi:hypothetical protein
VAGGRSPAEIWQQFREESIYKAAVTLNPAANVVRWAHEGADLSDFAAVVSHYPRSEFDSPVRSTVPLLAFWQPGGSRILEFARALGAPLSDFATLHFEYQVPVQAGTGKPSCTDLMILSDGAIVAIEAKFTEPRYEPVVNWLGQPPAANRIQVLSGWFELLQRAGGKAVAAREVAHLPYQLIHRAASACHPPAARRWLVYQLFDPRDDALASYQRDMRSLVELLGPAFGVTCALATCELGRLSRYAALEASWNSGSRDLSPSVLSGLLAGDLLAPRIKAVTAA